MYQGKYFLEGLHQVKYFLEGLHQVKASQVGTSEVNVTTEILGTLPEVYRYNALWHAHNYKPCYKYL
jgi:hypothetical protein